MAFEQSGIDLGVFTASTDLSDKQFYFVKLASATTVTVCTAITDVVMGVLQNNPTSGGQAIVRVFGLSKVSANESLSVGHVIGTSSDGQASRITLGSSTTVHVCGQAVEAASTGDVVTAFINITNGRGA
jgi:uncharacterized membrane protein